MIPRLLPTCLGYFFISPEQFFLLVWLRSYAEAIPPFPRRTVPLNAARFLFCFAFFRLTPTLARPSSREFPQVSVLSLQSPVLDVKEIPLPSPEL